MLGIIIGIAIFMFLVVIHELGHFTAAKVSGVKVLEFGVGIPPKLKKLRQDRSGTQYTLNAIPLGWFVRLKGENPQDPAFLAPDSFITANIVKKIIILIAGVTVNALFAYVVFVYLFMTGARPLIVIPENMSNFDSTSFFINSTDRLADLWLISGSMTALPVQIDAIISWWLAASIWLQTGDIIKSINQHDVDTNTIGAVLKNFVNQAIQLKVQRQQKMITLSGTCPDDNCFLGISMQSQWSIEILPYQVSFAKALWLAGHEIQAQVSLTFQWLASLWSKLFSFDKAKVQEWMAWLSGPVGAVKIADEIRQSAGRKALLAFAAMISLGLAIFNILPIPALDGGRILWVMIQRVSRMKAEKYFLIESYINAFFFVLLLGIGILIIFQDLTKIRGL